MAFKDAIGGLLSRGKAGVKQKFQDVKGDFIDRFNTARVRRASKLYDAAHQKGQQLISAANLQSGALKEKALQQAKNLEEKAIQLGVDPQGISKLKENAINTMSVAKGLVADNPAIAAGLTATTAAPWLLRKAYSAWKNRLGASGNYFNKAVDWVKQNKVPLGVAGGIAGTGYIGSQLLSGRDR